MGQPDEGAVSDVLAPVRAALAELEGRAEAIARQLASGPTRAFGEMRRLMASVADQPLETQLELAPRGSAITGARVFEGRHVTQRSGAYAWGLRVRRLIDVSRIDLSTKLFGETLASPVILSPVSSQRAFHPEGEAAAARADGAGAQG